MPKQKNKTSKKGLFLRGPAGIAVRLHLVADDHRFTVHNGSFEKLVGLARKGNFVWIHPAFSA